MKNKLGKIFLFIILFLVGFSIGLKFLSRTENLRELKINDKTIFVEIADTPQKRAQGLSDRPNLNSGRGMLFIFDTPGNYTFWMNKMKFNLDFVFINGSEVVELTENVPFPKPGEDPTIVVSKEPFDKVLEINSGAIQSLKIKNGDKIELGGEN